MVSSKKLNLGAILTILAVVFYFIVRTVLLSRAKYGVLDGFFGILLLGGESFFIIHAFGYSRDILKSEGYSTEDPEELDLNSAPEVAVIIATRNEPIDVLEDTVITVKNLEYPHKNIYILDDSSEQKIIDEVDELGERREVRIIRREDMSGAKAGAINNFLKGMSEKYLAIFDSDQNPMPGFLKGPVARLEEDEDLDFVQTPQFYTNIGNNPFAGVAQAHQSIFYEYIMEGKSESNAAFACGTNLVMRRDALLKVGGFDEGSVTEDFATSLKLHMNGSKSKYDPKPSVFGMAPESLPAFIKQQTRWASGTVSLLKKIIKNFFTNFRSLTMVQWWEYFLSGTYYFIGWAFFFLMICPIAFLIFDIPSYFASPEIYFLFYVPYLLLTFGIFITTMQERGYPVSRVYHGSILSLLIFPTLMKASLNSLLGRKTSFDITAKGKTDKLPLTALWPQILMLIISGIALISGAFRIISGENPVPLAVNMGWVGYHIFVLAHIFYYNRLPQTREGNNR